MPCIAPGPSQGEAKPVWLRAWQVAALLLSAFVLRASAEIQGWGIWGWVALVPLFLIVRVLPARQAALAGMWWGFVYAIARLVVSPEGGTSSLADLIAPCFLVGGYCFLGSHLVRAIRYSPFALALGWLGIEAALAPFGWRLGLLDAALEVSASGAWLSPLAGAIVAALAMALLNAVLAHALVVAHAMVKGRRHRLNLDGARPPLPLAPRVVGALSLASLWPEHSRAPPRTH